MAEATLTSLAESNATPPLQSAVPAAVPAPLDVSILVVTWNSAPWIERCLASIGPACIGLTHEIVICDNASADDTLDRVGEGKNVIRSQRNDGYAAATNRAFSRSEGQYVFLLNPDCELGAGTVTALHRFLEANARAAAAAPLLEDERGDSQREFQLRKLPTLGSLVAEVFSLGRFFPALTARYRYRNLDISRPQRVEQPAGAALLIRREVFEAVGPFDERFRPAWFEDVDYCRRLAAAGKEIWTVPTPPVRHFGGSSLETLSFAEFQSAWYRNMLRYARKWLGPVRTEILRVMIIISMVLRSTASLLGLAHRHMKRVPAFRAYANVIGKALKRWDDSSQSSS